MKTIFLRAIIIDDEQKGIDALKILINRFITDVKVIAESTAATQGIEMIENYKPDVVFLDINMPGTNGFQLLEKLSWKEFNLVFTTAHEEYALRALKNNAVDYLLKPIDHGDLRSAVERIKSKMVPDEPYFNRFNYSALLIDIAGNTKNRLVINSRVGIESVEITDIICFEAMANYVKIYLSHTNEVLTSKTLKEFDARLCSRDRNFMRVHNSYIINLNKISRYIKNTECIVMHNEQKIPLAKSKKDAFLKWLGVI